MHIGFRKVLAMVCLALAGPSTNAWAEIRWLGANGNWSDPQWEQPSGAPGPFFGVNQDVKIENGAVVTLNTAVGQIASLSIGGNAANGGAVEQTSGTLQVSSALAIGTQPAGHSRFALSAGLLDVSTGVIRAAAAGTGSFAFTGGTLRVAEYNPPGFGAGLGELIQSGETSLLDASQNNTVIHTGYQLLGGQAQVGEGFQVTIAGPMTVDLAPIQVDGQWNALNGLVINTALEKNGAGTLQLGGPQLPATGAMLTLNGGATVFHSDAGANGPNLIARVFNSGTTAVFNASEHFLELDVQRGATAAIAPTQAQPPYAPGNRYLFTNTLKVQALADSSLDLADGALIVNYGIGANRTAPMAKLLAHGINLEGLEGSGKLWDGNGLRSSTVRDDPLGITALGVIDNANVGYTTIGPNNQFGFGTPGVDGEALPLNATLVKYTYVGDADLNGRVDGDDLVAFLVGYINQLSLWENGDFDYNGRIDGDDLTGLLVAYGQQQAPLGSAHHGPRAVPEPAAWPYALWGVALLVLVRYSRVRPAAPSPLATHCGMPTPR